VWHSIDAALAGKRDVKQLTTRAPHEEERQAGRAQDQEHAGCLNSLCSCMVTRMIVLDTNCWTLFDSGASDIPSLSSACSRFTCDRHLFASSRLVDDAIRYDESIIEIREALIVTIGIVQLRIFEVPLLDGWILIGVSRAAGSTTT
jgi:hypothetical protein